MSARFWKELRPLLAPWLVGAAAGILGLVAVEDGAPPYMVAPFFFGSIALIAAMSFGMEFQHGTLPLLFSQPIDRSRLWREKLVALSFPIALLGALDARIHGAANEAWVHWFDNDPRGFEWLFVLVFAIAIICSLGLWRLATRSLGWSLLLGLASQLVVFGGLGLALLNYWRPFHEPSLPSPPLIVGRQVLAGLLIYCGCLAWLGRSGWNVKLALAAFRLFAIAVCFCVVQAFLPPPLFSTGLPALATVLILIATVCSAGLWTLAARSIIGGMTFTVAGQFLPALAAYEAYEHFFKPQLGDADSLFTFGLTLAVAALAYSAACLWLGWRKFARFEVRETSPGESAVAPHALKRQHWWLEWLRCRPQGGLRNLARKELRLQKPLLLLAGIFSLCWMATLAVELIWPDQKLASLFTVLACTYVPLAMLLAGTVSLGDERMLGLATWQLTLPVAVWRQWLVKLIAAATMAVSLGIVLPALLILLVRVTAGAQFLDLDPSIPPLLAMVGTSLFLCGFWAASLAGNTLRAALAALGLGAVFCGCAALGIYCADKLAGPEPLTWVLVHDVLGLWNAFPHAVPATRDPVLFGLGVFAIVAAAGVVISVLLAESLALFRRARAQGVVFKAIILVLAVFLASFCCGDVLHALNRLQQIPSVNASRSLRIFERRGEVNQFQQTLSVNASNPF
jgi:hypothetical protein